MKIILMLIVGLMLAGCESTENHFRNRDAVDRNRYLVEHTCGGHDMRLPLTIKPWRCLHLPARFTGSTLESFLIAGWQMIPP